MSLPSMVLSFLRGAIRRLPIETAAVVVLALTTVAFIHGDQESVWYLRLPPAMMLTVPLAFAARERLGRLAVPAGAAVAAVALTCMIAAIPEVSALHDAALTWGLLLTGAAALLTPFIAAAPRFSHFVRRFAEELTMWTLLGGLALGAVLIVGFSIDQLFDVNTKRVTADAMVLTAGAMLLVAIDRLSPERAASGKVPEIWRRMVLAIGAPFVAVMLVILVVYEATVLVRGELPRNVLSPLIIGAGFAGYVCTLIIGAILDEPVGTGALEPAAPHRFLRKRSVALVRVFPAILLALLPMALVAVFARVEQYGLTPFRVVRIAALLCLTALGLLGTWRLLRRRGPLTWQVPALVAGFAALLSVGPVSAISLSARSQAARLDRLLTEIGVTSREVRHGVTTERELPFEQWQELVSTVDAIAGYRGEEGFAEVLQGDVRECAVRWIAGERCLAGLGLAQSGRYEPRERSYRATIEAPTAVPAGALRFFDAHRGTRELVHNMELVLRDDAGNPVIVDISSLVAQTVERASLDAAALPARRGASHVGVALVQELHVTEVDGERIVTYARGVWIRTAP